jgi:protein subunit release factor A
MSKELSDLGDVVDPYKDLKKTEDVCKQMIQLLNPPLLAYELIFMGFQDVIEITQMIIDSGNDPDMKDMAQEEYKRTMNYMHGLEQKIVSALVPNDCADEGSAIIEIRAGIMFGTI